MTSALHGDSPMTHETGTSPSHLGGPNRREQVDNHNPNVPRPRQDAWTSLVGENQLVNHVGKLETQLVFFFFSGKR